MKSQIWKTAGLVVALCSSVAMAQEAVKTNAAPAFKRQKPGSEEMLKRFDTDDDGTLSEAERQAMHEAMPKQRNRRAGPPRQRHSREEVMKRFDTDGDGVLSEVERAAMHTERERLREENRKRFDADGDGQLSEEERKTMHETLREERSAPPPEQGGDE